MTDKKIDTFEKLQREFDEFFYDMDRGILKIVCACIVANRLPLNTAWLMIVAPPGGGKSEVLQSFNGLDFVHPISDLTTNTFASGAQRSSGETSLLLKINNGVLSFKDFTSILSKGKDEKREIMGQLREIFDGEYTKRTGTGEDIKWRGKIGAVAGVTEAVYSYMGDMSVLGDRFIMYSMKQPNRKEVSRRMLINQKGVDNKRGHLQDCVTEFVTHVLENINDEDEVQLSDKTKEDLLDIADFVTMARSGVITDYKTGNVEFVPTAEMPTRMMGQLYTLASGILALNKVFHIPNHPSARGALTEQETKLLMKVAFDSIPRTRRDLIVPIAEYRDGVTTAGLATRVSLPTDTVKKYLSHLNALNVVERTKNKSNHDIWIIKDEYRAIVVEMEGVRIREGEVLEAESDLDDLDDLSAMEWGDQESLDSGF